MTALSDRRRTAARRGLVGFVYQFHHLLPEFSALENVVLPQLAHGVAPRARPRPARRELLDRVGVERRAPTTAPPRSPGASSSASPSAGALANAPAPPPRRRAHRQPRPRDLRPGVRRAHGPRARHRARRAHRHPQPRPRRAHGPDAAARRGAGGRRPDAVLIQIKARGPAAGEPAPGQETRPMIRPRARRLAPPRCSRPAPPREAPPPFREGSAEEGAAVLRRQLRGLPRRGRAGRRPARPRGSTPPPADLTRIAARHGGAFPPDFVMSTIDGFHRERRPRARPCRPGAPTSSARSR